eukprot:scpid92143/ scgid29000/ 
MPWPMGQGGSAARESNILTVTAYLSTQHCQQPLNRSVQNVVEVESPKHTLRRDATSSRLLRETYKVQRATTTGGRCSACLLDVYRHHRVTISCRHYGQKTVVAAAARGTSGELYMYKPEKCLFYNQKQQQ